MNEKTKKWLKFTLRWGVAVVGITWVVANINFRDRVMVLRSDTGKLDHVRVKNDAKEEDATYRVVTGKEPDGSDQTAELPRDEVWVKPDWSKVKAEVDGKVRKVKVLAVLPGEHAGPTPGRDRTEGSSDKAIREFLVEHPDTDEPVRVPTSLVQLKPEQMTVSSPRVEVGLNRMAREADWKYMLGAILVLPLSYLLTSIRWHLLMRRGLDIQISQPRAFVINMVGAFYNSFMPGTTGGDLVKAYYVAKHTPLRTRAVLSVIIDRAIGLFGLIILGGAMAAMQWHIKECRQVAMLSGAIVVSALLGLVVFYTPTLRRATGLNWVLRKLPMQRQVHKAVEAMELYGRRPMVAVWALIITFPVHMTSILSATLAGKALGLGLDELYYWAVVPVIALVGAIPISPQGAGVMEFFTVLLTKGQGVTVSQAFALTMSIRLIQMLWNLVAGVFVFRGGYHAPTAKEQDELESDEGGETPPPPGGGDNGSPVAASSSAAAVGWEAAKAVPSAAAER